MQEIIYLKPIYKTYLTFHAFDLDQLEQQFRNENEVINQKHL